MTTQWADPGRFAASEILPRNPGPFIHNPSSAPVSSGMIKICARLHKKSDGKEPKTGFQLVQGEDHAAILYKAVYIGFCKI